MVQVVLLGMALAAGYLVTVGLVMLTTFGLVTTVPQFAVQQHRLRSGYQWTYALLWLLCVSLGVAVAALLGTVMEVRPRPVAALLAVSLVGVLWWNGWEARQRGLAHQILLSLLTAAGAAAGLVLAGHLQHWIL
ncbi:MAG: hypothetical protein KGK08_03765 [Acidobacteriota bacterium]|nr:hypothetical protein [Acidobacteriota bacterium]